MVGKVFSEVGSGRNIGPFRRDLQRFLVEGLTIQATAKPGQVQEDVRMLAWDNLKRLSDRLGKAKAKEDMTSMHLRDLKRRIDAGRLPHTLLPAGECIRATAIGASE